MSVTASDIYIYGTASMPEDNTTTVGGAIDRSIKMTFTKKTNTGQIRFISTSAEDTQNITVFGRTAGGTSGSEVVAMSGLANSDTTGINIVGTATPYERVLKLVSASEYSGLITVTQVVGGATIATMEGQSGAPGNASILQVRRPFYGIEASGAGGQNVTFYEKVFVTNTNSVNDLTTAAINLTTDALGTGVMDFELEDSVTGHYSQTDRVTVPPTTAIATPDWYPVGSGSKSIPAPGSLGNRTDALTDYIGMWMRIRLAAGETAENDTVTYTVTGSTT